MKTILRYLLVLGVGLISSPGWAQERAKLKGITLSSNTIGEPARFIFYSVLEGLYEDGLSKEDVAQILMRKKDQFYFHFIYSCPVCGPTIWALEAYQGRPEQFYGLKRRGSTFGNGLSPELHELLYSEEPTKRLSAINTLVKGWLDRRMKNQRLTDEERAALVDSLEKMRKDGMRNLKMFREEKGKAEMMAPAYLVIDECAVCNGAVGKAMKVPEVKPGTPDGK